MERFPMKDRKISQNDEAYAQDAYLQWWYFDAIFEDGHRLLTFFLPRNTGSLEQHPADQPFLDIVLKPPSGEIIREGRSFSPKEFSPRKGSFGASFGGDCSMDFEKGTDSNRLGRYLLKARADRLAYDLQLVPDLPPWSPNGPSGLLSRPAIMLTRRSLFTKDYFHYAAFVPRGRLEGQIVVDGKPFNVRGSGYHEQGRNSFPLREFAKAWYWLHIESPPWTILSGTVVPLRAFPGSMPRAQGGFAFVQNGDRRLMGVGDPFGVAVKWSRVVHHSPWPDSEDSLAWETRVRCLWPGRMVTADVVSREVLEHVRFHDPEKGRAPSHWSQTIAEAKVKILDGFRRVEFDAECVLETMVTGA
jgi:hypothetical protein